MNHARRCFTCFLLTVTFLYSWGVVWGRPPHLSDAAKGSAKESQRKGDATEGATSAGVSKSQGSTARWPESGAAGSASDPAALARQVERLRSQVKALQQMVDEMRKGRARAGLDSLARGDDEAAARTPARISGTGSAATAVYAQQPVAKPRQKEQKKPGRGLADKGLYGGTAAGPPGARYGRSLYNDMVHFGGYGSFRFEANTIDPGPRIGALPPIKRGFNSFDFRRLVLTTDVTPADRLRIYTEIEFERFGKLEVERTAIPENRGRRDRAGTRFIQGLEGQSGSELKLEQAWAQYDLAGDKLGARVGVILPPLGRYNILHDDDYWDIPRRTLVDRDAPILPAKAAWSELGAGVVGSLPMGEGFVDYQFYVVNGVTLDFTTEVVVSLREGRNLIELEPEIFFDSGPVNGSDTTNAVTWRVALSPKIGNEIAFSGYHGRYTPDYLNVRESVNSVGIDGKLTLGALEAEGEFIYTDYGRLQRVLDDIARQFVDVGAETLGDETSELESEAEAEFAGPLTNQRYGFWVDLKYRWRPQWLRQSFLGEGFEDPQLIPIVRYERVWFNHLVRNLEFSHGVISDLTQENLSQDRITVGLTYRPIASVPISIAYEHTQRRGGSRLIFPNVSGIGRLPDNSFDTLLFGIAFGF